MPIDFRVQKVEVPLGTGLRTIPSIVAFGSPVRRAGIALNGFKLDYVDDDHHIDVMEADVEITEISGNTVVFNVDCRYNDRDADDLYQGYVTALVIADVA